METGLLPLKKVASHWVPEKQHSSNNNSSLKGNSVHHFHVHLAAQISRGFSKMCFEVVSISAEVGHLERHCCPWSAPARVDLQATLSTWGSLGLRG